MKISMQYLRVGMKFKKYIKYSGTIEFIVCSKMKQSTLYKNEYNMVACCLKTKGDFKRMEDYTLTSVVRYGSLGSVELINN